MTMFSILIATKNSQETIIDALMSVTQQTCKDFEVIIIDAKSEDNTIAIARRIIPNSIIISEADNGIYDALNKGLRVAKGDWIYVLGSDDKLANDKVLELFAHNIENTKASLIYGNIIRRGKNEYKLIRINVPEDYKRNSKMCPPIFHQSAIIKSNILSEVGLFPLSLRIHADHFLMSCILEHAPPLYLDENICIYNSDGFSRLSWSNFLKSSKEIIIINLFLKRKARYLVLPLLKNLARIIYNKFHGR